jgi:hypothetical protein
MLLRIQRPSSSIYVYRDRPVSGVNRNSVNSQDYPRLSRVLIGDRNDIDYHLPLDSAMIGGSKATSNAPVQSSANLPLLRSFRIVVRIPQGHIHTYLST